MKLLQYSVILVLYCKRLLGVELFSFTKTILHALLNTDRPTSDVMMHKIIKYEDAK